MGHASKIFILAVLYFCLQKLSLLHNVALFVLHATDQRRFGMEPWFILAATAEQSRTPRPIYDTKTSTHDTPSKLRHGADF
uniref:Putative secreted protein n=1 Tax=Ixodes ricinus TaxID=34613 RepID=A0A6B0TWE7_IXORI